MQPAIRVFQADYQDRRHAADLLWLLEQYACDAAGGGQPLSAEVRDHLIDRLAAFPTAFSVLAYADDQPCGLANCMLGFSTFAARPLVNIHDLAVVGQWRGLGVSQRLLQEVERLALQRGCVKLTLEVLEGNTVAVNAYRKFGFDVYRLDPAMGDARFLQKKLT